MDAMTDSPAVVFDLDDTLIHTSATFEAAREEFGRLMAENGFSQDDSAKLLWDIDLRRVEAEGFGRSRFPLSMRDTYAALCQARGVPVDPTLARRVERIGANVYDTPPPPFDETFSVLQQLTAAGCALYLLTKGDPDVQQFRIDQNGLRPFFDGIHIYPRKGRDELRAVTERHALAPQSTWVIGDGIRSDINPAIEMGLLPILVGTNRWQYEDVPPVSPCFYHVPRLAPVPSYVLANGDRPPLPAGCPNGRAAARTGEERIARAS